MRFWDSSAFVPLYVEQEHSSFLRRSIEEDPEVVAWILTEVEVRSAFERLRRAGELTESKLAVAVKDFEGVWAGVRTVLSLEAVKLRACRLLAVHALRAADALQLAAALVAASDDPRGVGLVSLDSRLVSAARREGFVVLP